MGPAEEGTTELIEGAEDTEFEDADGTGMDDYDDDGDINDEDMLDEEEIAESVEAEEGQIQLQIIDEQAFQEVVNDLAASDPASAAALRWESFPKHCAFFGIIVKTLSSSCFRSRRASSWPAYHLRHSAGQGYHDGKITLAACSFVTNLHLDHGLSYCYGTVSY